MNKSTVMVGMIIGSLIGGYIPSLWGAGAFSISGIIFSGLGGLGGIWLAWRFSN